MRLIDADALIVATANFCNGYKVNWDDKKVMAWINSAPTIEAEPVKHGRWIDDTYCSNCNGFSEDSEGYIIMSYSDYCPHCGTKMDLQGED